jgi:hypothetical protein
VGLGSSARHAGALRQQLGHDATRRPHAGVGQDHRALLPRAFRHRNKENILQDHVSTSKLASSFRLQSERGLHVRHTSPQRFDSWVLSFYNKQHGQTDPKTWLSGIELLTDLPQSGSGTPPE